MTDVHCIYTWTDCDLHHKNIRALDPAIVIDGISRLCDFSFLKKCSIRKFSLRQAAYQHLPINLRTVLEVMLKENVVYITQLLTSTDLGQCWSHRQYDTTKISRKYNTVPED